MNTVKRYVLLFLGILFVVIGSIGIIVPVLPTTPFMILAALCFSVSSPRMESWLSNNRYFGEYIDNYRKGTGVSKSRKIIGITSVWIMLFISIYFVNTQWVDYVLIIVGILVSAHIALLKGKKSE